MSKQLETFKSNLEEFASKHKQEIRKSSQFRVQFQEMCATIGVDPLACEKLFEFHQYIWRVNTLPLDTSRLLSALFFSWERILVRDARCWWFLLWARCSDHRSVSGPEAQEWRCVVSLKTITRQMKKNMFFATMLLILSRTYNYCSILLLFWF